MKSLLFLNVFCLILFHVFCVNIKINSRSKRAAYELPDGWYLLRNSINPSFECESDGYYADIANGCQLYHVCQFINIHFSKPRFLQYTFICGNGTVFNQMTQTCTFESQLAVPCESSGQFFYMNQRIGELNALFHTSDDFEKVRTVNNNNNFDSIINRAQSGVRPPGAANAVDDGFEDDDAFR